MSDVLAQLPDWSKTIDAHQKFEFESLRTVALAFVAIAPKDRREQVKSYSEKFCFPKLVLPQASGLYVLLRLAFQIPEQFPRAQTKTFGGWLHPSIGDGKDTFNLAWPVAIDERQRSIAVERFTGYFGKGYDAIGEYDYFAELFPIRTKNEIEKLKFCC